jgi:hypothetical protein
MHLPHPQIGEPGPKPSARGSAAANRRGRRCIAAASLSADYILFGDLTGLQRQIFMRKWAQMKIAIS